MSGKTVASQPNSTKKQLLDICEEMGIAYNKGDTKAQLISRIEAVHAAIEMDEAETPPAEVAISISFGTDYNVAITSGKDDLTDLVSIAQEMVDYVRATNNNEEKHNAYVG